MKTQKMSLANIQGKITRAEMKNIMAGSGSGSSYCGTYSCGSCPAACACGTYRDSPCVAN